MVEATVLTTRPGAPLYWGFYWGPIGVLGVGFIRGYIGIMENKMETGIYPGLGFRQGLGFKKVKGVRLV